MSRHDLGPRDVHCPRRTSQRALVLGQALAAPSVTRHARPTSSPVGRAQALTSHPRQVQDRAGVATGQSRTRPVAFPAATRLAGNLVPAHSWRPPRKHKQFDECAHPTTIPAIASAAAPGLRLTHALLISGRSPVVSLKPGGRFRRPAGSHLVT